MGESKSSSKVWLVNVLPAVLPTILQAKEKLDSAIEGSESL